MKEMTVFWAKRLAKAGLCAIFGVALVISVVTLLAHAIPETNHDASWFRILVYSIFGYTFSLTWYCSENMLCKGKISKGNLFWAFYGAVLFVIFLAWQPNFGFAGRHAQAIEIIIKFAAGLFTGIVLQQVEKVILAQLKKRQ